MLFARNAFTSSLKHCSSRCFRFHASRVCAVALLECFWVLCANYPWAFNGATDKTSLVISNENWKFFSRGQRSTRRNFASDYTKLFCNISLCFCFLLVRVSAFRTIASEMKNEKLSKFHEALVAFAASKCVDRNEMKWRCSGDERFSALLSNWVNTWSEIETPTSGILFSVNILRFFFIFTRKIICNITHLEEL